MTEQAVVMEQDNLDRALVVEDDPQLLRLLVRYLQRAGLETDGVETAALAVKSFTPGVYTIVLADLTLPDGSGLDLLGSFLRADPKLRGVLCSGYPLALDMLPASERGRVAILQKPFSPRELLLLLRP